jgi:hypothetical protein
MKHIYTKYKKNNCWQYPSKEGIWHRERERKRRGKKNPDVLTSMCTLGDYVLSLILFSTHACSEKEFDEFLEGNAPDPDFIYGYSFSVNTRKGECLYCCELSLGLWFDTINIDDAEKASEYIWNCMEI